MTTRPMLTQREAASACGIIRTTIRRRSEAGDLPGAVQDPARDCLIPVDDLLAAGFRVNAPAPPDTTANPDVRAAAAGDVEHGREHQDVAELERVRHAHELELAEARHGRELAEATAEHLRSQLTARCEHIEDLQRALAALMPAPQRPVLPQSVPTAGVPGQAHLQPSVVRAQAETRTDGRETAALVAQALTTRRAAAGGGPTAPGPTHPKELQDTRGGGPLPHRDHTGSQSTHTN